MKLISEMSEEALLEQLLEECGELVQVLAKRLRIIRGESPTPVTDKANLKGIIEECADVCLCIDTVIDKLNCKEAVLEIKNYKTLRWIERLNKPLD